MRALTREQAEALEALVDQRLDATALAQALPLPFVELLEESGLLAELEHEDVRRMLERRSAERTIEWGTHTTTQGDVLAAFATHCRDELTDVDVVEGGPTSLEVRWRSETSRFELRARSIAFPEEEWNMSQMRGTDLVVEYLLKEKVPYLFGYAGHGAVGLLDGVYNHQDELKIIFPRIEVCGRLHGGRVLPRLRRR